MIRHAATPGAPRRHDQRWPAQALLTQFAKTPARWPAPMPNLTPRRRNEMAKTLGALMFGEDKMLAMNARSFGIKIKDGQVQTKQGSGPLAGARASLESAGQIDKRFTATRLALAGPLALAWRKAKDRRELYLTIEGDGYAAVLPLDPEKSKIAHSFVGAFNNAAAVAS